MLIVRDGAIIVMVLVIEYAASVLSPRRFLARLTLCRVPISARRSRAHPARSAETGPTLYKFAKLRNA